MKRFVIFALSLLISGGVVLAQKIKPEAVPPGVMKAYIMKIADTIPTSWEKHGPYYTARFTKSKLKASMVFQESSEWVWTRWEMDTKYVPKKVKEYITTSYPGYKIANAIVEYKPGGEYYLIGLKKGKDIPILRFGMKSEFIDVEPSKSPASKNAKATDNKTPDK